jgi:hypothetical protein
MRGYRLALQERRIFVATVMTAEQLVPYFQMASTIVAAIGIMFSVSLGIASLKNSKRDRLLKVRPDLLFNIGGQVMDATISPLQSFPGKSSDDPQVQIFKKSLPADAKGLDLRDGFGQLFNHGQGSAFATTIWFEPQRITSGGQERWLTKSEQGAPPYTKDWNSIPAMPANVPTGESASFFILPISVYAAAPHTSAISGRMRIECRDAEGNAAQWRQDATFFIDSANADKAAITVSFEPRSA